MKTKIGVQIDTDLWNLLKSKLPDFQISEAVEQMIAEQLNLKKSWVDKDATSIITLKTDIQHKEKKIKPARSKHNRLIDIWSNVSALLNDEFISEEYSGALLEAGFDYSNSSLSIVSKRQLDQLVELKKIVVVSDEGVQRKHKYKKIKVQSELSEYESQKFVNSLKSGSKVLMGTIR